MPSKRAVFAASAAALVLVAVVAISVGGGMGGGCSSRDQVTARVTTVSADLQRAAAQGAIPIERLADGIKRLNTAATAYETTQDHQAYCDGLDALSDEFKLRE